MSDSTSTSKNTKVISKYFASSPVMDESLSDFKEKKTAFTGPKNTQKPAVPKGKTKKAPKRIRGQKDIRNALKPKKNELLAYAKEFDDVCKKSGIDVDTEQLQLAIALSKSVQSEDSESGSIQSGQSLSSQDRIGKIRTTLQEYGFTVPEVKINNNKRKKKLRKNYKLILTTEEEKKQIISDKYANILLGNFENTKVTCDVNIDWSDKRIYYLSTNVPYMQMKNNDVLYVDNLVERSSSKGSLLRDWSDIPGRPESPKTNRTDTMNFSEIECSQEELDVILSGTIKSAKNIINNKKDVEHSVPDVVVDCCDDIETNNQMGEENQIINHSLEYSVVKSCTSDLTKEKGECLNNSTLTNRIRSCSPDIFDDEVSAVYENTNDVISGNIHSPLKQNSLTNVTKNYDQKQTTQEEFGQREDNETIVNVTKPDCNLEINSKMNQAVESKSDDELKNRSCSKVVSYISQGSNCTRRISNDFMEITECIVVSSEVDSKVNDFHKSNLTQIKNKTRRMTNDLMEITECVAKENSAIIEENIDLTQNSDEQDATSGNLIDKNASDKVIDISQSSNSNDELPFVQMSGSNKNSLDDTILLDSEEIMMKSAIKTFVKDDEVVAVDDQEDNKNKGLINMQQKQTNNVSVNKSTSQSFFDEFVHNHSDDEENTTSPNHSSERLANEVRIDLTQPNIETSIHEDAEIDLTQPYFKAIDDHDEDEVDLTQSSDSFEAVELKSNKSVSTAVTNCLGKIGDVSIDYDELYDDITRSSISTNAKVGNSSKDSGNYDVNDNGDGIEKSQSHNSEVFNVSDKEFEYSLNQSKNDFAREDNFGGISILDDVTSVGQMNTERNSLNYQSMSDSFLPVVNIKKDLPPDANKKDVDENNKCTKPFVGLNERNGVVSYAKENALTMGTPLFNKYIVKTDQVTPMLDYGAMSTPERNKELEKYGLKPFKRKRAIQLLTHLYNQTHPIVEACPEDLPSPSKKKRYSSQPSPIKSMQSPNKFMRSPSKSQKSPRKPLKSPCKNIKSPAKNIKSSNKCFQNELQKDENEDISLYAVTNEVPDIKDINCAEEDWIFQKREKAKLHSCRVPLHIALHNYVTCRRRLREAILKYEPVNIDVIHKELVASGHRYDPKDLLRYMDKKCITVKTTDNNARNNRR